jgi:hypothetical protein
MRSWAIRGLLLALLVASVGLGAKLSSRAERGADLQTAVRALLTENGLTYRETKNVARDSLISMLFAVPSCAEPLQVVPTPRTFDATAFFDRIGAPGDIRFFAYLDRISAREDRFSFFLEHLKHSALGLFALTPYQADGMMLMVSEPRNCAKLPRIDWSVVWRRDYRTAVARGLDPVPQ